MEKETQPSSTSNSLYYIVGVVALVLVLGGGYLLRPKSQTTPASQPQTVTETQPTATPTPKGPITKLACESQYYNPILGFPKYYLSVEGVDVNEANEVDCTFAVSVAGKVVATESAKSPLTDAPERNGKTFRCTTKALELKKNVATKVEVEVKDDQDVTTKCSRDFLFP